MDERNLINDKRNLDSFKIKTFSGFKKNEVFTILFKSIEKGKVEDACHWTTECILSGYSNILFEKLINFSSKIIHINNPNLPNYLLKKNKIYHNQLKKLNTKCKDNILLIRNSQMIRNLFFDIVVTLCISLKTKRYDKLPKINIDEDFEYHNIQKRLCAKMNILPSHIIHFNDPDELRIIINEIFTLSKNYQFGYDKCCYWIQWIFEWESLHKKQKKSFNVDNRYIPNISKKLSNDIVWILWETVLEEMKLRNDINIKKQILSLFNLYCHNFTLGKRKQRLPLLFHSIGYLTHKIKFNLPIRNNYQIFIQSQGNVNQLFYSKKIHEQKNPVLPPKKEKKKKKSNSDIEIIHDKINIFNEIDSLII